MIIWWKVKFYNQARTFLTQEIQFVLWVPAYLTLFVCLPLDVSKRGVIFWIDRLSSWVERLSSLNGVWITVFQRLYTVLLLCTRASWCFSVDQEGFFLPLSLLAQWWTCAVAVGGCFQAYFVSLLFVVLESARLVTTREQLKSGNTGAPRDTKLPSI